MVMIANLDAVCDRKSFYGKCAVIMDETGHDYNAYLRSYDTIVCYIDNNGILHRTWSGYSATTMRHINAFCRYFNLPYGGKSWWESLDVETLPC